MRVSLGLSAGPIAACAITDPTFVVIRYVPAHLFSIFTSVVQEGEQDGPSLPDYLSIGNSFEGPTVDQNYKYCKSQFFHTMLGCSYQHSNCPILSLGQPR
jgi:hypothetical protein